MEEICGRIEIISELVQNMKETENNFDLLEMYVEDLLYNVQEYRESIGE